MSNNQNDKYAVFLDADEVEYDKSKETVEIALQDAMLLTLHESKKISFRQYELAKELLEKKRAKNNN